MPILYFVLFGRNPKLPISIIISEHQEQTNKQPIIIISSKHGKSEWKKPSKLLKKIQRKGEAQVKGKGT